MVTVMSMLADFPSLVAVIVVVPGEIASTTPLELTVATVDLLLVHVTVRPESVFPAASFIVAVIVARPSVRLSTTKAWSVVCDAASETDATGAGVTVMAAVPFTVPLVALMVAVPTPTPVTTPELLTVAMFASLVPHVTVAPLTAFPEASSGAAVSVVVAPTAMEPVVGETETDATPPPPPPPPPPLPGPVASPAPPQAAMVPSAAMAATADMRLP
jgi:hypothetical protein